MLCSVVIFLNKISKEYWIPYIVDGFARTGKLISAGFAERICDTVQCHSWYVQQLSFFVWSNTDDVVTEDILNRQIQTLIDTNMPMFMNESESLSPAQIGMLAAVSNGEEKLNSQAVVRNYKLGNQQTITRNKKRLQELDIIERRGDRFVFVDAVYELWFRQQYWKQVNV